MNRAHHQSSPQPAAQARRPGGSRSFAVGAVATLLLGGLGTGAAFGYFTAGGSGQGTAATADMQPIAVTVGTPLSVLVPGGTADVTLALTNPNGFAVTVLGVVADGPTLADPGHSGCTPTSVQLTGAATLDLSLAAGETQTVTLQDAASMGMSAPSACQGATFSIPLTTTARAS